MLYAEIDRNKMFVGTAAQEDRSRMNICFVMAPEYKELEADFMKFATERGMVGIKGHRSVCESAKDIVLFDKTYAHPVGDIKDFII